MGYSIEYLITIESKGGFCNSVETFNNLLKAYSEIKMRQGAIIFKELNISYVIDTNEISSQNQRYFHLCFTIQELKDEEIFLEMLKMFREIIIKASGKINVLWDDLSAHYSNKSYPLVHEVENLLRKLISKFMLLNLGMEWSSQTVPAEIQQSIKNKRSQAGITDILHDVDFIQLSDFLFKPYQTKGLLSLYNLIEKIKTDIDFDNKVLLEYIPKSNWERYFAKIVDCEDGYLVKRWQKLYELRCLIAHNTVISKKEYDEIVVLCIELKTKFIEAINDLAKVVIPESDFEILHENVASNLNSLNGKFLELWKNLQSQILDLLLAVDDFTQDDLAIRVTVHSMMKLVEKYNVIDQKLVNRINQLRHTRHQIVHETSQKLSEAELEMKILDLQSICNEIKKPSNLHTI